MWCSLWFDRKTVFSLQFFIDLALLHIDLPNFSHCVSKLRSVLYRNHMVPGRQRSAAHEIPNHWVFPSSKAFRAENFCPSIFVKFSFVLPSYLPGVSAVSSAVAVDVKVVVFHCHHSNRQNSQKNFTRSRTGVGLTKIWKPGTESDQNERYFENIEKDRNQ